MSSYVLEKQNKTQSFFIYKKKLQYVEVMARYDDFTPLYCSCVGVAGLILC